MPELPRASAPVLAVTALLLASACAETGTFEPAQRIDQDLVAAGIAKLAASPMLEYEGVSADLLGDAEPQDAEVHWRVTSDGLAIGDVRPVDWEYVWTCRVGEVPTGVFVDISVGCNEVYRDGIQTDSGMSWAFMAEQMWMSPGDELTPEVYALSLGNAIETSGALWEPMPKTEDLDGIAVYPLEVGGGTVYMAEDGTIQLIENVEVNGLGGTGYGVTVTVDPRKVDADAIIRAGDDLAAMAAEWEEALFFGNRVTDDEVEHENAVCDGLVCTVEADMTFTDGLETTPVYSPVVEFTGTISTGLSDVGDATCSQTKTVDLNVTVHFECTVDLTSELASRDDYSLGWVQSATVTSAVLRNDTAAIATAVQQQTTTLAASAP